VRDTCFPEFPTIVFDNEVWAKRHNLPPKTLIESSTAEGSTAREEMIHRWKKGEPAPYLVNHFYFRDRCFRINPDAYITDPEATYLVDAVKAVGNSLVQGNKGLQPRVTEFGIGAGTLAISVALECPHFQMSGFDLDAKALQVALENQKLHKTQLEIFESDFFQSWPHAEPPHLIFADPPWGSREDLYDDDRDAEYYDRMPPLSAYPKNGRIGLHEGILDAVGSLGWSCPVVMNLGVIPPDIFQSLLDRFKCYHIYQPTENIRIVVGFMNEV
jgi:methylase of polypeptide subunit release factors